MRYASAIVIATLALSSVLPAQESRSGFMKPGETFWGSARYIEYVAGDLPLIIAVPHAGELTPEIIPDRPHGIYHTDLGTQELARMIADELKQRTGRTPHLIINRLKRKKLDANREPEEAAQSNEIAETAWRQYHSFIDTARQTVHAVYGTGLFIDLHGHAHENQRIELGYALTAEDLAQNDETLNDIPYTDVSTLANLLRRSRITHAQWLRDTVSFGAMLVKRGIPACPSPQTPRPEDEEFYAGGYSVRRHTAEDGLNIFGVQIELPLDMRQQNAARLALAPNLTEAIMEFLQRAIPERQPDAPH